MAKQAGRVAPWVWGAAALTFAASVAAQEAPLELGHPEVVALAAQRSPEVVFANRRVEVARGAVAGARPWLSDNPSLEVNAGPRFRATDQVADVYVTLNVPLEIYGVRGLRLDAATRAVARDGALIDAAGRLATAEALAAFYRALHAEAVMQWAAEQVALATAMRDVAVRRRAAGEAGDLDALAAGTELARARRRAVAAGAERESALADLRLALGLGPARGPVLRGALSDAPARFGADLLTRAAPGARADLVAATLSVAAARAEVALEERRALPVPVLRVGYQLEETANVLLLGAALPLPFFQRNQGPIAESSARLRLREAEHDALRLRIDTEVDAARRRLTAALAALRVLEEDALPNLGETLRLAQRSYELGQSDLTRLLVLRQQATDTRREQLDATLEIALAGVALEAALGRFR